VSDVALIQNALSLSSARYKEAYEAVARLAADNERWKRECKDRWPDSIYQETANGLLEATIRAEDERQARVAAEGVAERIRQAFEWIDAGFEMPEQLQPGSPDLKPFTISVTRTAAGWRKGQALLRAALADREPREMSYEEASEFTFGADKPAGGEPT
jgi:hypothetical protein